MMQETIQTREGYGYDEIINLELLDNHTYILCGYIDDEKIERAIRWLIYENFRKEEKTLTFYINSQGGNLNDAFALIDMMKNTKHSIRTIGMGSVMSSAFLIFAAGSKGLRYISRNTSILSHQYSAEIGEIKHHDIKSYAREAEYTNERMIRLLKECSNLDTTTVKRKLLPPSDVWLTVDELIDFELADHIL